MAKLTDTELTELIDGALERYSEARSVEPGDASTTAAQAIARAIDEAGVVAIRDERRRWAHMAGVIPLRKVQCAKPAPVPA